MTGNGDRLGQRILDAAGRLFLQYGFKRTTMEDIAAEAGMAKGSLYLHFSSKEDIFQAAGERQIARILGGMRQVLETDLSPQEKLREMLTGALLELWDFCHQAPHAPDVWAEAMTAAGHQAERATLQGRKMIAQVIAEGQRAGAFDSALDSWRVAELVQMAVRGFQMPYLYVKSRQEVETRLPQLLDLIIRGLRCEVHPAERS